MRNLGRTGGDLETSRLVKALARGQGRQAPRSRIYVPSGLWHRFPQVAAFLLDPF